MSEKKYWFKPKRFWGIFAAYYPVSGEGWVVVLLVLAALVWQFGAVDVNLHSASDTLLNFVPRAAIIFIIFDIISRITGVYPSWWREVTPRRTAIKLFLVMAFMLVVLLTLLFFLRGDEDTWICRNGTWVRHGNPSALMPEGVCK